MTIFKHYKDIRSDIQTGDLYFTASKGLISYLIRLFTGSKISHVGMFVCLGSRVFIVECMLTHKCRMMYASERFKDEKILFVKTNVENENTLLDKVLPDVSKIGYNTIGALLSLFIKVTPQGHRFCSEWVAEKLGIKIRGLRGGITPQLLLTHFK